MRPFLTLTVTLTVTLCLALATGCGGGGGDAPGVDAGAMDAATDTGAGPTHVTVTGEIHLEFNPTDGPGCATTFTVDLVEDRTSPWLCPAGCEVPLKGLATATEGATCLELLSSDPVGGVPQNVTLGWSSDGSFRLALGENRVPPRYGTIAWTGDEGAITVDVSAETATLTGSGTLTRGTADGPAATPTLPETYACGWSRSDAPPYTGDYVAALDAVVPDAFLTDACGETVRLHDFVGGGRWTVVVMNGYLADCPPCVALAMEQSDAVASLEAELGIDITVVTLLVEGYRYPLWEPDVDTLTSYADLYDITDPVLADRGWWAAEHCGLLTSRGDGCYYPATFVVNPEGRVVGFLGTSWDAIGITIRAEM